MQGTPNEAIGEGADTAMHEDRVAENPNAPWDTYVCLSVVTHVVKTKGKNMCATSEDRRFECRRTEVKRMLPGFLVTVQ